LYIGTLGRRYDVATILEAAKILDRNGCAHIQFVICGEGDQSGRFRRQAHGLENVLFTGWVRLPEISALLASADIGIVAINDELPTLPNKLFEYLSAGIPVVSCARGEAVRLVTENNCGLTYTKCKPDSLAAAIRYLSDNDQQRNHMGNNALRVFEEKYTWRTVYGQMATHLERLADHRAALRKTA
jgi:glycosyltransferase involved in cell wall biosynthesis